jgi:hypothetical protein
VSKPESARDLLKAVLQEVGSKASRRRFQDAIEHAVGERLAPHLQVLGFRRGKLTVQVDSSPLLAELRGFRSEEIRQRCNEVLKPEQVAKIDFRMEGTANA